jgi:hypothetical protein
MLARPMKVKPRDLSPGASLEVLFDFVSVESGA